MSEQQAVVDQVRRVFDDLGEVADRLREAQFTAVAQPLSADPIAAGLQRERERVVGAGIRGLAKLADGRDQELREEERFGLEAIVVLEGRPAILIQQGDFAAPPREWARLADRRREIREVIARCGRVEVTGHLNLDWVGTASLVAPGTLMTNRHVAQEFCSRAGDTWVFRRGMSTHIDFLEELGNPATLDFEITEAIGIHERHDLALLRVETASMDGDALPDPLAIAATEPEQLLARDVYAVGYPAWDGRRNEPEPIRRLFMDIYNVKRLQPGQAMGLSTQYSAIQHDCSTLGGNSGSPLVDLETNEVIGLHFGGRYGVGNYAVPLWTLVDDPLMRKGEVNFR